MSSAFSAILSNAVAGMTPLLLAAMGGLFTELAGSLNIALEGLMLMGAFSGIVAAHLSASPALGVLTGLAATALVAWVYGKITISLKANIFITGLAVNIFAAGLTAVLSQQFFKTKSVLAFSLAEPARPFAQLAALPFVGPILFGHTWFVYLAWILAFAGWVILFKSTYGMRLRATGSNPKALIILGKNPETYAAQSIVISGLYCALAGMSLSFPLSAFVPNISAGRGWVALVAIYLGAKKPAAIAAACFVFALAESYSNFAQGSLKIPSEFILAIPYIVTLLALISGALARRLADRK